MSTHNQAPRTHFERYLVHQRRGGTSNDVFGIRRVLSLQYTCFASPYEPHSDNNNLKRRFGRCDSMSVLVVSRSDLQRKPLAWAERVSPALELRSAIDTKRIPNTLPSPSDRPDYFYKTLKVP
jgi:hypothetical protein